MMRRDWMTVATLMFASAALTAQGPGGFGRGFGGPGFGPGGGPHKVVTGKPYTASATESSVDKLADGATITHTSTITEARDTEGRTVRVVTTTNGGKTVTRTSVFDPVAHTSTDWTSGTTVAIQFQLPSNPPGGRGQWAGPRPNGPGPNGPGPNGGGRERPQVTTTTLAPETIAGDTATGVKTTITVPAGAEGNDQPLVSTRQVYTSTDLGIVLSESSTSPREGTHTLQVTSLSVNPPDPTLFQVPANYTVRTESRHRGM